MCCFSSFMDSFLEALFRTSSPVLVAVSKECFPSLLDRFLDNDGSLYLLTYLLVLGFIE